VSVSEEISMGEFKLSTDFSTRIMAEIQSYEAELNRKKKRMDMLLHSRISLYALSAAGIILGIFNFIRFAFILLSPAPCL
jgi:hypothetical protein